MMIQKLPLTKWRISKKFKIQVMNLDYDNVKLPLRKRRISTKFKILVMNFDQDNVWNRCPKRMGKCDKTIIIYLAYPVCIVCMHVCVRMCRARVGARLVTSLL